MAESIPTPAGIPCRKSLFYKADAIALATSFCCLVVGLWAIQYDELAWHLGVRGQLIVFGFVLGIMNLCLQTTAPYTYLLLETRFGQRHLQNYEAIQTGRALTSRANWVWRLVLLCSIALPLGLSVAYKTFLGGEKTRSLYPDKPGRYGLSILGSDGRPPFNDSLYFSVPIFQFFRTAMEGGNNIALADLGPLPKALGYNLLLLSDSSAAVLDVPSGEYVSETQSRLRHDESWLVTTTVNATIVTLDKRTETYRTSSAYWADHSDGALYTTYLYHRQFQTRIGWLATSDGTWFGSFFSNIYGGTTSGSAGNSPDLDYFRANASLYSLRRARCHGTWQVNKTSVSTLLSGTCHPEQIVQDGIVDAPYASPDPVDVLPVLKFPFAHERNEGLIARGWEHATGAMGVGISYWARAMEELSADPAYELYYDATDETILSTRTALRTDSALYLVLAAFPALHLIAFLITIWLHSMPIGRGFGLISLLAGFEAEGQPLLSGASLSGSLSRSIILGMSPEKPSHAAAGLAGAEVCMRYSVTEQKSPSRCVPRMKASDVCG